MGTKLPTKIYQLQNTGQEKKGNKLKVQDYQLMHQTANAALPVVKILFVHQSFISSKTFQISRFRFGSYLQTLRFGCSWNGQTKLYQKPDTQVFSVSRHIVIWAGVLNRQYIINICKLNFTQDAPVQNTRYRQWWQHIFWTERVVSVEQSDELFHGIRLQLNSCIKHQAVLISLFQIVPCASLSVIWEQYFWNCGL